MAMMRSAGLSRAGMLPLRRGGGVAGDHIMSEAAGACSRAAGLLLLRMMGMVPCRSSCDGVGHNISVECAGVGVPVPTVSGPTVPGPSVFCPGAACPAVSCPAVRVPVLSPGFDMLPDGRFVVAPLDIRETALWAIDLTYREK